MPASTYAHVTVKPAEVLTASFQTYTVTVPNEKSLPTILVKIIVPSGVDYVTPTVKPGWNISVEKEGTGDAVTVKSITWSGGEIGDGLRDEFTFGAKSPSKRSDLQWKAYQTYADGTAVSWDKTEADSASHDEEGSNSGPVSITSVVDTQSQTGASNANKNASLDKTDANRALYVAVGGVVLGLAGIFLATRKK